MALAFVLILSGLSLLILSFLTFIWQTRSQNSKHKTIWALLLFPFIIYIPVNLILLSSGIVELRLNDFGAYYNAADRWLHDAPLYLTTREVQYLDAETSADMPYLYLPIFVLLFVPFALLPVYTAGIVFDLVSLTFLIWSVAKLLSTFELGISRKNRLLIYFVVISFGPTVTWMKLGQVSGLLAGFLCLSGATLRSKQHGLSGFFATIGSIIKPFYAPSGAHLLRHQRRLFSAVMAGAGIVALSLFIFGIDAHLEYIRVLEGGKGWETAADPGNWHATHFNPFYILGPLKHLPRAIIVLAVAGLALYSNRTDAPIEYIFALGISIVPLAAPTTNTLALNAVIPSILIVAFYKLENGEEFPILLAVSALLIHIHPYTVDILSKFGPNIYEPLGMIAPVIPLLQPALYGMLLLVGYLMRVSWGDPID